MATEVLTGGDRETQPGRIARFIGFLREVRNELRKVTWPTFDELKKATTVIVIFVTILKQPRDPLHEDFLEQHVHDPDRDAQNRPSSSFSSRFWASRSGSWTCCSRKSSCSGSRGCFSAGPAL